MRDRGLLRILVSITLLVLSVLGIINVIGDNTDVKVMATRTACEQPGCDIRMLEESRNPLWQTFRFDTLGKQHKSISVVCHRALFLLGDYQCLRQ